MRRDELQRDAINRVRIGKVRSGYEKEIIQMLPSNLDVTRVYCGVSHTQPISSSQGQIEIDVKDYSEAITLLKRIELEPSPMCKVTMEREQQGYIKTVSFYPEGLVRPNWREKHEVTPIYPVIFQMMPYPGSRGKSSSDAKVYLEWFVKVREGMYANVRVTVANHSCMYTCERVIDGIVPVGMPRGSVRSLKPTPTSPEYVTVYWDMTCFNGEYTLADLLTEVAHV